MEIPIYKTKDLERDLMEGETFNNQFAEFIDELLRLDEFENDTEKGIVKKVSAEGTFGLTENQIYHIQKVYNRYNNVRCKICDDVIPISEVLMLDGGLCSYHQHQWNKDE